MSERAHKWFWFTAVASVFPIFIYAIILLARGRWAGFPFLIERGELFLISVVLLASSIGDLFTAGTPTKRMRHTRMAILGVSMVLAFGSAVWYAVVLDCLVAVPAQEYNEALVSNCSLAVFGSTLLMGLACAMLSTQPGETPLEVAKA